MTRILLLALLLGAAPFASAQSISTVGIPATLDVGAWNVEQFQISDPQMANVTRVILESGVDIWSLEEVTSDPVLEALLARLGDEWAGGISQPSNLRTAFVYRKDTIRARRLSTILTEFSSDYAGRPPLMLEADVTLPDTTVQIRFISLHMKCCSDASSWERRKAAGDALKNRLDFLYPSDRVIVLGDFNDETGSSITAGRPSPYSGFVSDPNYRFLIEDLAVGTFCGSAADCRTGSTIDNILISDELFGAYLDRSGDRFQALLTELDRYVFTTSDHLPVTARFAFTNSTAVEPAGPFQPALRAWPVPAVGSLQIETLPGDVASVYDLLGRRVAPATRASGSSSRLDLSPLRPGLYVVRVTRGRQVLSLVVPVVR